MIVVPALIKPPPEATSVFAILKDPPTLQDNPQVKGDAGTPRTKGCSLITLDTEAQASAPVVAPGVQAPSWAVQPVETTRTASVAYTGLPEPSVPICTLENWTVKLVLQP